MGRVQIRQNAVGTVIRQPRLFWRTIQSGRTNRRGSICSVRRLWGPEVPPNIQVLAGTPKTVLRNGQVQGQIIGGVGETVNLVI